MSVKLDIVNERRDAARIRGRGRLRYVAGASSPASSTGFQPLNPLPLGEGDGDGFGFDVLLVRESQ